MINRVFVPLLTFFLHQRGKKNSRNLRKCTLFFSLGKKILDKKDLSVFFFFFETKMPIFTNGFFILLLFNKKPNEMIIHKTFSLFSQKESNLVCVFFVGIVGISDLKKKKRKRFPMRNSHFNKLNTLRNVLQNNITWWGTTFHISLGVVFTSSIQPMPK